MVPMYNVQLTSPKSIKTYVRWCNLKIDQIFTKKLWDDVIPWRLNCYVLILFVWLATLTVFLRKIAYLGSNE